MVGYTYANIAAEPSRCDAMFKPLDIQGVCLLVVFDDNIRTILYTYLVIIYNYISSENYIKGIK